jgi:hypothetical protein
MTTNHSGAATEILHAGEQKPGTAHPRTLVEVPLFVPSVEQLIDLLIRTMMGEELRVEQIIAEWWPDDDASPAESSHTRQGEGGRSQHDDGPSSP